jgi:hypothetical protein
MVTDGAAIGSLKQAAEAIAAVVVKQQAVAITRRQGAPAEGDLI